MMRFCSRPAQRNRISFPSPFQRRRQRLRGGRPVDALGVAREHVPVVVALGGQHSCSGNKYFCGSAGLFVGGLLWRQQRHARGVDDAGLQQQGRPRQAGGRITRYPQGQTLPHLGRGGTGQGQQPHRHQADMRLVSRMAEGSI